MEVIHFAVTRGKFVNRGFLTGPVCPVYGLGVLFVLQLLLPWENQGLLLFFGSMLITTMVEYFIGWLTEKTVHRKLWDYSEYPFNIKGYICLRSSLIWGFLCIFVIKIINPFIQRMVGLIPEKAGWVILAFFGAGFITDLVVTGSDALNLSKQIRALEDVERLLLAWSDGLGEELANKVFEAREHREELEQRHPQITEALEEYKSRLHQPTRQELEQRLEKYRELINSRHHTLRRWESAYPRFNRESIHDRLEKIKELFEDRD